MIDEETRWEETAHEIHKVLAGLIRDPLYKAVLNNGIGKWDGVHVHGYGEYKSLFMNEILQLRMLLKTMEI